MQVNKKWMISVLNPPVCWLWATSWLTNWQPMWRMWAEAHPWDLGGLAWLYISQLILEENRVTVFFLFFYRSKDPQENQSQMVYRNDALVPTSGREGPTSTALLFPASFTAQSTKTSTPVWHGRPRLTDIPSLLGNWRTRECTFKFTTFRSSR